MSSRLAQRVADFPPYPFAGLEKRVTEMAAAGKNVIRLDMGSPDQPPAPNIIKWARIPSGSTRSVDFCNQLLEKALVSITPGTVFGQQGEGYVRISLGQTTQRIAEAMERLKDF